MVGGKAKCGAKHILDEGGSIQCIVIGGWFSSLDYFFIKVDAKIKDTEIRSEVSCFGSKITVGIQLGKGADGFLYLESLVHAFGAKGYENKTIKYIDFQQFSV